MAKFKKIIIVFLSVLLLIPSFSVFADETTVPSMQSVYGIWNKFSMTFTDTVGSNKESIINWADASNTPTNITVGFKFDMLPRVTYEVQYHFHSDNGQRYNWIGGERGAPVAVYSDLNISINQSSLYSHYEEILLNSKNLIASSTYINSSASAASYDVSFQTFLKSDTELSDSFKYITFFPELTAVDPDDKSFQITFQRLNIYYDPDDISGATLEALDDQIAELKEMGVKLDAINTNITNVGKDVSGKLDKVDQSIKDLPNQMAQLDKDEGNKAQNDAMDKADDQAGELNDSDQVGGLDIIGKLTDFWSLFSSTDVATSITFPGATNPFTGDVMWEEAEVDFSPWLNNTFIKYLLVVARLFISLGLLWWLIKLYYDLINSVLNKDAERSPIQVVLGLNPFK